MQQDTRERWHFLFLYPDVMHAMAHTVIMMYHGRLHGVAMFSSFRLCFCWLSDVLL